MTHPPHLAGALALHRRLREGPGGGPVGGTDETVPLVWSPYSVAAALELLAAGARGATYRELASALAPDGRLEDLAGALAEGAQVPGGALAVSNALWVRGDVPFREEYQRAVLGRPGGALHRADFAGDPEGARREINADVEKTTRGLIQELLPPGVVHPDVAAVLANALYLRVGWLSPFPERDTAPRPFHAPTGTRDVATMRQRERMRYAEAGGWRLVTLPADGDVVADAILPPDDLGTWEARLDADTVLRLYRAQHEAEVTLWLPRFRVAGGVSVLNDPLRRVGVRAAFDPEVADFSGITPARVWVEAVAHKAVLRVDEGGLEGAAATAAIMRLVSAWAGETVELRLDRPFLFLVRHAPSGAVYFLARVTDPGEAG